MVNECLCVKMQCCTENNSFSCAFNSGLICLVCASMRILIGLENRF